MLERFFMPIALSREVTHKPKSVTVEQKKLVIFRGKDGQINVFDDRCPHRGIPLSLGKVRDSSLVCAYHGWQINALGEVKSPQMGIVKGCRLKTYKALEMNGVIWATAAENSENISRPSFPQEPWDFIGSHTMDIHQTLEVVLDNFSEDEHFPYVHKFLGWDEKLADDLYYKCTNEVDHIKIHYRGPQRKFWGMRFFFIKPGDYFDNQWTIHFAPISMSFLATTTNRNGQAKTPLTQNVHIYFVPITENLTRLFVIQFTKVNHQILRPFLKLLGPLTIGLTRWDLGFDKKLLESTGPLSPNLDGLRLGRFDQPMGQVRRMIREIYRRNASLPPQHEVLLNN